MIEIKLEGNLVQYLQDNFVKDNEPLQGMAIYRGHDGGIIDKLPRLVVTALDQGGDLAQAGVKQVLVSITIISSFTQRNQHGERVDAIMGIFSSTRQEDNSVPINNVLAALNAPAAGPDNRVEKEMGISCMGLAPDNAVVQARDEEKKQFGHAIQYVAYAHLAA